MTAIQIFLVAFAAFAMSRVFMRFRKGGLAVVHLVAWFFFWSAAIVAVVWPTTTQLMARLMRVGRGADLVMYLSVVVLFYALFRMFGRIEELERQITRVVRAAALKELDEKPPLRALPAKGPPPIPPKTPAS